MPKELVTDVLRHKKFDRDIRELASRTGQLSSDAEMKASKAKSSAEQEFFRLFARDLEAHRQSVLALRHRLWEAGA